METSYDSYEIGFSGQLMEDGEVVTIFNFDQVSEWFDDKIKDICEEVGATEPPLIFLTGDKYLYERHLKKEFVPNFREEIAVTKPYKGTRKQEKPFHFYNLTEYMLATKDVVISEGCEADDLMGIAQFEDWQQAYKVWAGVSVEDKDYHSFNTVICSRDKDLRMIPGWHYSWECGGQVEVGPIYTDELGCFHDNEKIYGLTLFYYQLLTGDVVDNIPGCKGVGPVRAKKLLGECKNEKEMFDVCVGEYKRVYADNWKKQLKEQATLLWIQREPGKSFNPIERGLL